VATTMPRTVTATPPTGRTDRRRRPPALVIDSVSIRVKSG